MKYYIIAGESSGDFIGQRLISSLKAESKNNLQPFDFKGVGGIKMQKAGLNSLFDIKQINLMGFVEIIPRIFNIKKLIDLTVKDIVNYDPKILITIDSPGFTFRVASAIKNIAPHIKLVHIVAPSVWAYKPSRAKKYAQIYDHMLTLLPFEPEYFKREGMKADCIGHPIIEQDFYRSSDELRKEIGVDQNAKLISVTAGSRVGEIKRHMPIIREVFNELSKKHPVKVIFVQEDKFNIQIINSFLQSANFDYSFSSQKLKVFAASDCALAKSGTNTLEISLSRTSMVVGYKMNYITYWAIKMMANIKYASLVNIISDKEIIEEYLQSQFNVKNIVSALDKLLSNTKKSNKQVKDSLEILKSVGFDSKYKPSEIAAKIIMDMGK